MLHILPLWLIHLHTHTHLPPLPSSLHTTSSNVFTHNVLLFLPVLHSFPPSEESDYHTDYEEEALESALSDMELYNRYGEHTEGEETGDTVRTTGVGGHCGAFSIKWSPSVAIAVLLGTSHISHTFS